jgi:hypothetical protein
MNIYSKQWWERRRERIQGFQNICNSTQIKTPGQMNGQAVQVLGDRECGIGLHKFSQVKAQASA